MEDTMKKAFVLCIIAAAVLTVGGCRTIYKPVPCATIEKPSPPIPLDMVKVIVTDKVTKKQAVIYGVWEKDLPKFEFNIKDPRKYGQRCYDLIGEDKDSQ
jgi:hypothetical protein